MDGSINIDIPFQIHVTFGSQVFVIENVIEEGGLKHSYHDLLIQTTTQTIRYFQNPKRLRFEI